MDKEKKYKVKLAKGVMEDMEDVPEDVEKELNNLIKGFKDGSIDPKKIGEPVNMEKLREEEPDVYNLLIERTKKLDL